MSRRRKPCDIHWRSCGTTRSTGAAAIENQWLRWDVELAQERTKRIRVDTAYVGSSVSDFKLRSRHALAPSREPPGAGLELGELKIFYTPNEWAPVHGSIAGPVIFVVCEEWLIHIS